MTKQQLGELKTIADNYKALPVQMGARFVRLLREVSSKDRYALADVLRDMLADARKAVPHD